MPNQSQKGDICFGYFSSSIPHGRPQFFAGSHLPRRQRSSGDFRGIFDCSVPGCSEAVTDLHIWVQPPTDAVQQLGKEPGLTVSPLPHGPIAIIAGIWTRVFVISPSPFIVGCFCLVLASIFCLSALLNLFAVCRGSITADDVLNKVVWNRANFYRIGKLDLINRVFGFSFLFDLEEKGVSFIIKEYLKSLSFQLLGTRRLRLMGGSRHWPCETSVRFVDDAIPRTHMLFSLLFQQTTSVILGVVSRRKIINCNPMTTSRKIEPANLETLEVAVQGSQSTCQLVQKEGVFCQRR